MHNDGDTSDHELYDDTLVKAYKILYLKWITECKARNNQKEKFEVLFQDKACLMTTISDLNEEVHYLNSKLEGMTKFVCMLNYGSETLDEILGVEKIIGKMK